MCPLDIQGRSAISLPPALRKRLDREAARQRRSRSFVVAEANERSLAEADRWDFEEGRKRTRREALALSPAERVRLAEELWSELARGSRRVEPWKAAFDTFEEVLIEPTLENVRRALRALEGLTFGIAHAEALEDLRRLR